MLRLDGNNYEDYIDFSSGGIFSAILGMDSEEIKQAMIRPELICSYAPRFGNYWRDKYVEMLLDLTGYEAVALFSAGTEATEAFWRACRTFSGKPGVWGGLVNPDEVGQTDPAPLADQMHGMTLGALIMSGRQSWPELMYNRELGASRYGTAPEATSCMIMEPYHAASAQFHKTEPTIQRIKDLQKEFTEIPLCVDEIQGGFGRTGRFWAHEHYDGLKPDFIAFSKAAGGGLPLSGLLGPAEYIDQAEAHMHSTHSGNPVMCSVGIEILDQIRDNKLVEQAAEKGKILEEYLSNLPQRTHCKGLLAGIEFKDADEASAVVRACESEWLIVVETGRRWVKIGPPLNIDTEDLITGCTILTNAVERTVENADTETHGDIGKGH